jgi:hypothetical protein
MNRILSLLFAGLALVLGPHSALAQRIDSPYRFVESSQTLGVFGTYIDARIGAVGLGPQPGPAFGVRYGIRLGGPFDGEADVFVMPTTRMVLDTAQVDGEFRELGDVPANLAGLVASLRFNITGARTFHGFQPFVAFGGGAVLNTTGRDALEEDLVEDARFRFGTSFAGLLGTGTDWFLSERLSLRADARALLWKLRTPQAFRLGGRAAEIPADEWQRNGFISLGISYHF